MTGQAGAGPSWLEGAVGYHLLQEVRKYADDHGLSHKAAVRDLVHQGLRYADDRSD